MDAPSCNKQYQFGIYDVNSNLVVPATLPNWYKVAMRCKDIRLIHLKRLVADFGSVAAVARVTRTNETHLRNIINRAKTESGKEKNIGDELAEALEQARPELPPGWLDLLIASDEAQILAAYRGADDAAKNQIIGAVKAITAGFVKSEKPTPKGDLNKSRNAVSVIISDVDVKKSHAEGIVTDGQQHNSPAARRRPK